MSLPAFGPPGLRAATITRDDVTALTRLCVACSEFFQLVEHRPGSRQVAEDILALLPPGGTERQKHLVGVLRDDELVAIVDMGEDYPAAHDWYVALFLVTPRIRGLGVGARVWDAVEAWVREQGGTAVRLVVQQQNPRARGFWERLGFTMIGESTQLADGGGDRVWRMWKPLAEAGPTVGDVAHG